MKRTHRLRNIGVLAHVDAGKTTVTERMLFAAGRIHRMGEVHHGASTMDFREVERRRGVTVSAAASSIAWRDHRVTLLDTPGHVDFSQEVERALLAIDGAVVLFSGVAGVEPQTETVWRQADRFRLPRIGFVNKMDMAGADFARVIAMIESRLGARAAAVQWPVTEDGRLIGALDLIGERWLTWPRGAETGDPSALAPDVAVVPDALRGLLDEQRLRLVDAVFDALAEAESADDAALARYVEGGRFEPDELRALVRRATLCRGLTPVLAGAAYRGVGVTSLLDAVVDFAPSPLDRGEVDGLAPNGEAIARRPAAEEPLSALASKVAMTRYGPLATVRVVSGRLARDARVLNVSTGELERVGRVLALHADETEEVASADPGEIVAVSGLKGVRAGDSLADPKAPIAFAGLSRAEPVMEAVVEAESMADQAKLKPALAALAREDPSLVLSVDAETGALLLAGMGELHLQVALETLAEERGVRARLGQPKIAYREAISRPAEVAYTLRKQSGGPGQFAKLTLRVEPLEGGGEGLAFEDRSVGGVVPREFVPAIEAAVAASMTEGVLAGYPMLGVRVVVLDGAHHAKDSSSVAFAMAARAAFREALSNAGPLLLEPIARVEAQTPEAHVGAVVGDLQARRGTVLRVEPGTATHAITAEAPLANLWGYSDALRSLTRGRGQAGVSFSRFAPAPSAIAEDIRPRA